MTTLICSSKLNITSSIRKTHLPYSRITKIPRITIHSKPSFNPSRPKTLPLNCTNNLAWEESTLSYDNTIMKGRNIVEPIDTEEAPEIPVLHSEQEQEIVELNKNQPILLQKKAHTLNWIMWILGPCILLVTGIVPTLWLPLSSVFVGPTIAGFLSLVGLDCIFNMGAMLFLLMADSSARPNGPISFDLITRQISPNYRICNLGASIFGLIFPLLLFSASCKGTLQPQLQFLSFMVLLGPYLLLLAIQMLTEMLTWHWRSPVWLVTPVVYEGYRVLQLMRGINLAGEIGAPGWTVQGLRGLVSWWVFVLCVQLMRVSWFVGSTSQSKPDSSDVTEPGD